MMDLKQLRKLLGSLSLAGLLSTAYLALPACSNDQPAEHSG